MFLYHFSSLFRPRGNLLDVGCGCGILGLLLKRDFPSITLSMIDVQESHICLAKKNVETNRLNANLISGNFADFSFENSFDFIISNPPFYHKNTKKSEDKSLIVSRYADALPLSIFLEKSSNILNHKGILIFCYDAKQSEDIFALSSKFALRVTDVCFVHAKPDKESSLVLVALKKNSKSSLKIHSPFFVFEGNNYTKEAKKIFEKADTRSVDWL